MVISHCDLPEVCSLCGSVSLSTSNVFLSFTFFELGCVRIESLKAYSLSNIISVLLIFFVIFINFVMGSCDTFLIRISLPAQSFHLTSIGSSFPLLGKELCSADPQSSTVNDHQSPFLWCFAGYRLH